MTYKDQIREEAKYLLIKDLVYPRGEKEYWISMYESSGLFGGKKAHAESRKWESRVKELEEKLEYYYL